MRMTDRSRERNAAFLTSLHRPSSLALLGFLLSAAGADALAFPIPTSLGDLARRSELIVVARITSVRGLPVFGDRWATAEVVEVWKGPNTDRIKFLASSPTFSACDVSDARRGEEVVLFLSERDDSNLVLAHSGRGRMPIRTIGGKRYACSYRDVSYPRGTSIASNPDPRSSFKSAVLLEKIREIVTEAIHHG